MNCTNCGAPVGAGDAFCGGCGQSVSAATPLSAYPPAQPMGGAATFQPLPPPPSAAMAHPPTVQAPFIPGTFLDPVTHRPLATWWRRFWAWLLDSVIIGIPVFIAGNAFGAAVTVYQNECIGGPCGSTEVFHRGAIAERLLLDLVVAGVYFTLMVGGRRGQTVGMMAAKVAVRDANGDQPIGMGRALLRFIVVYALGLVVIPVLIDFLSPLWDRRRQAWHDHAANSVMVDTRM
jgi:uncharacterized RDD family membrane protein YckC